MGSQIGTQTDRRMVYLDNAATSFPKPREVLDRMVETYASLGVSPGRGSYDLAVEAGDLVDNARRKLATFFNSPDPDRVVFAANASDALNLAIQGMVGSGDHVVSTRLEHNSVLRPLHHLKARGWIEYDLVPFDAQGYIDPSDIARAIRPNTRLVVVSHASNVLGTVQPVSEVARICAERGVPFLVDAAQSAGLVPIRMTDWQLSAVAFTGHKGLLGPSGIGGLVVAPEVNIASTRFGGTGVESRSPIHTQTYPHRLEVGTLNLMGVIGLALGVEYIEKEGIEAIHCREMALAQRLRAGLSSLPRVKVYGKPTVKDGVPVVTCNVEGLASEDVGAILDGDYNIAVRTGLHCAPLVHTDLGTDANGGVRFSLGRFNIAEDIDLALEAMEAIASS